ncbi:hypothetical protein L210DRAFT_680062 [Boletus edulis BED1]|uniref:Uncharacterized protein n=1 Tax=Boletus edulis BED1 TaxID=1328754 RepID=A0AAD4BF66_BOLED|nr:hypothetical protein L210DRAFT_680062 [Boletus edulis BED1]
MTKTRGKNSRRTVENTSRVTLRHDRPNARARQRRLVEGTRTVRTRSTSRLTSSARLRLCRPTRRPLLGPWFRASQDECEKNANGLTAASGTSFQLDW